MLLFKAAYNQLVCMVLFMSVVTMDEAKCEVCRFVCAQKEKKVKVGRDSNRSELFGSDMTSASDEQVSSCVTLVHMYTVHHGCQRHEWVPTCRAWNKYVDHQNVYLG